MPVDYQNLQPSTSIENSFLTFASLPKKIVKLDKAKRQSREKLSSKTLTSTPLKEELEKAQEKRKLRENKLKGTVGKKTTKKRTGRKWFEEERPEESSVDFSDICDDSELHDVDLSFIPYLLQELLTTETKFAVFVENSEMIKCCAVGTFYVSLGILQKAQG